MFDSSQSSLPVLSLIALQRSFIQGGTEEKLHILNDINLDIYPGEIVALVGPSGSGKTTLLQIIGLLEPPDSGTIRINQKDTTKLNDQQRTKIRLQQLGFVYQYHHLLPEFTALENVIMPLTIAEKSYTDSKNNALSLLRYMGLEKRINHRPGKLSGGEQQRVAIARALVSSPTLLLADEPTGNLDPQTSQHVFSLLLNTVRNTNSAAIIATHNPLLAQKMDRILYLKKGVLLETKNSPY